MYFYPGIVVSPGPILNGWHVRVRALIGMQTHLGLVRRIRDVGNPNSHFSCECHLLCRVHEHPLRLRRARERRLQWCDRCFSRRRPLDRGMIATSVHTTISQISLSPLPLPPSSTASSSLFFPPSSTIPSSSIFFLSETPVLTSVPCVGTPLQISIYWLDESPSWFRYPF